MDKKDKKDYWLKIIVLSLFCLAASFTGIYAFVTCPITFLSVVYLLGMTGGGVLCGVGAWVLYKEYKRNLSKE